MNIDADHKAWLMGVVWPDGVDTPDGLRYLAMARGEGAPKPYHYRWLLPWLLGEDRNKWRAVSLGSLVGMVPAMRWLTGKWAPGMFVFTLDGVAGTARKYPVLTDAPAMLAAILGRSSDPPSSVGGRRSAVAAGRHDEGIGASVRGRLLGAPAAAGRTVVSSGDGNDRTGRRRTR